jgi:ketosteroid isomerase-like protein
VEATAPPRDQVPSAPLSDAALAAEWVAGFTDGWRAPRDAEAFVAHFNPMLSPDVRLIQPQLPTLVGRRAFYEQFAKPLFALIPDVHAEVERWAASGDALYIELTLSGMMAGTPLRWRACDRITLRDGVAVERESYFDPLPLLLAVIKTPRAWPGYLRLRARALRARFGGGRGR